MLSYRLKLVVFLISVLGLLAVVDISYSALNTLSRLNAVEAERDQWQRPQDVLKALDPKPGNTIVDLGCGSGYFTLKLSSPVGKSGHVIAEDIRLLPLAFLWVRTILRGEHNIIIIRGEPDDPHLPINSVNALLISNTYHEFTNPNAILVHVKQALMSGGRLVVVDRESKTLPIGTPAGAEHEISSERVDMDLRQAGLEILDRQDNFIHNDPDREIWWLIIARKP